MSTLKKKTWHAFARMIKAMHADQYGNCQCVTCDAVLRWDSIQCHAGHFVGGRGNAVLFDEEIVRPQCFVCNMFRGGEQAKFALYLKKKEGKKDHEIEELLARRNAVVKFSKDYLITKAQEFNSRADAFIVMKGLL